MSRVRLTRDGAEVPANGRLRARRAPVSKRAGQAFLDLVATGYSVSAAAQRLGLHRQRLYELRDREAVFRRDWQHAVEAGTDLLEQTAWEIATKGALEEVFDESGRLVSSRRRQDPVTVRFLLAARAVLSSTASGSASRIGCRVDVEHQLASGPVISLSDVIAMQQRELEPAGEVVAVKAELVEGGP